MNPLASIVQPASKVMVGNDAAWHLSFHQEVDGEVAPGDPKIEFGRSDYYAEIQASLSSGLEGGVYSFTIEGLTDDAYARIAQGQDDSPSVVRLYLYWRDTNASAAGYVKNLAGLTDTLGGVKARDLGDYLIAELRIARVTRRAGNRRYETTVTAKERVFAILDGERLCLPPKTPDPIKAAAAPDKTAEKIVDNHGFEAHAYILEPAPGVGTGENPGTDDAWPPAGRPLIDVLKDLGRQMEDRTNRHGRGMYLIRDGKLQIGPRDIDVAIAQAVELDLARGLIQVEKLEELKTDERFNPCKNQKAKPPTREQYRLTLKGRPDVKPGGVVKFNPHADDFKRTGQSGGAFGALVGALSPANLLPSLGETFDKATLLYIQSVEHRQGRTSGWVTTVTGVVVRDGKEAWDHWSDLPGADDRDSAERAAKGAAATSEQRAAHAVTRLIAKAQGARKLLDVGEVRRMVTSGRAEPPGQTLTVWTGLEQTDTRPNQGRRLSIRRPSAAPAQGVAYVTPFAWGKCGLVLPRYPGTRVLVGYRNGQDNDPMALGAVWESGHGPSSEAGDWWLILPVDVPESQRAGVEPEVVPVEHTGKVTHDLIDAAGRRAIEVAQLTITVGKDTLKAVGNRPVHGADDVGVTIEHKGAKVMIKDDGTIVLEAAKDIELKAPSGDISLTANNVNVHVSGSMDVGS